MARKRGFLHRHFFVKEESTLLFRIAKSFYATNSYTTYFLQMTKSLWKSKFWIDVISLKCEANESVQFSTCYDPIHRFWRVKTKSSFFSKIKTCLRKKKCTTFLVLLRSTCVQKLSQFEFLTLAIKISYLFDFCRDVFLNVTV